MKEQKKIYLRQRSHPTKKAGGAIILGEAGKVDMVGAGNGRHGSGPMRLSGLQSTPIWLKQISK